ncbi:DUF2911 domain-containing protein [Christiangramia forsetii]|uniref:DUF2911 domain-containing protein n=2 Tax=Christiangramia forsetii TaxID=411153 RepID=A0LYQ7_CHRFK|nr:DUF2911 domain-containing protein [Christiangramia forsetii]GGG33601.1 hypothetical protein GCM10011532_16570 [Christiangramia forsetii]CAL65502.1 conserved hypothetical protein [Christiangramia forsetii KT0803]
MSRNTGLILKIGGAIVFLSLIIFFIIRYTTKAHSPEDTVTYEQDGLKLEVFYNRPYKKDRAIFGKLVPYNKVWRTGANEATTFETNKDILVDGSILNAGKYSLWTIPMENSWKVIFNSKMYPWGINLDKEAYRDPKFDTLVLERPVEEIDTRLEQFTILFEQNGEFVNLVLAWDNTSVSTPLKQKEAPAGTSYIQ